MLRGFTDRFSEGEVQKSVQNCRLLLVQFQVAIAAAADPRSAAVIQAWKDLQTTAIDALIPELNHALETQEAQSSNPALEAKLRSLNPEVTRLIKLLQIDWQFWQAARQPDRTLQRQQQLLTHLKQLDQLLEAIGHHLSSE